MSYGGNYSAGYGSGGPGGYGGGGYTEGGFAPRPPAGPPPGADSQLWQWFESVDTDRSGHITAEELQRALINGDWSPFDLDTVKMLMTIFDADRTGTIVFNEFSGLWNYIKEWQNVFRHFDRDRSGFIDAGEFREALTQFGYNLNPRLVDLLQRKYSTTDAKHRQGPASGITFDRFVRACVVVKQLTETFHRLDSQRSGLIHINYDQFLETYLSAP